MWIMGGGDETPLDVVRLCGMGVSPNGRNCEMVF